jgi:GNAT superfamily N-acetyltransferase
MADIKQILDDSFPEEWPDLVPPSLKELQSYGRLLPLITEKEGVLIARAGTRPVGLIIAVPDYNPLIKQMNGSLFPLGIFRFLYGRRRVVKGARILVIFVNPGFHRKTVSMALLSHLVLEAHKRGYTYADASTIGEDNIAVRRLAEYMGVPRYRTYRLYIKDL